MRTAKVEENKLKSTLNMKMIHPQMNKVLVVLIQVILSSLVQLQVQAHQLMKLKIHQRNLKKTPVIMMIHLGTLEETHAQTTMSKEMNQDVEAMIPKISLQLEIAAYVEVEVLDITTKKLIHSTIPLHPIIPHFTITHIIRTEASVGQISISSQIKLQSNAKLFVMLIQNVWHSNMA